MADEILDPAAGGAPAESGGAPDAGTPPADDGQQLNPLDPGTGDPAAPDFESLFADPTPEPVDPNAPPAALPPEFQQALGISEYVKEPAQLQQAVRAADEIWGVENGKVPVHQMLEGFRARNPEGFAKIVRESLIPYVEQITGQKLGGAQQEPQTPEQQRIAAIEQRFQQQQAQEQQAQQQQQIQRADQAAGTKVSELLKGTFLEGTEQFVMTQLAPYLGVSVQQSMREVLSGNTSSLERGVKAFQKQMEDYGRAYAKHTIAESRKLKQGLPAGKGNPRTGGEPDLSAMNLQQKAQYLAGN